MAKRTTTMMARRGKKTVAGRSATRRKQPAKASKTADKRSATPRRASKPTQPPAASKKSTDLQFSRVTGPISLAPPKNCIASVLLKLVARDDGHRIYAWWLSVGREGNDFLSVAFDVAGADVIRCDVPETSELSAKLVSKGLDVFLKTDPDEKAHLITAHTVVRGEGGGGTGTP